MEQLNQVAPNTTSAHMQETTQSIFESLQELARTEALWRMLQRESTISPAQLSSAAEQRSGAGIMAARTVVALQRQLEREIKHRAWLAQNLQHTAQYQQCVHSIAQLERTLALATLED